MGGFLDAPIKEKNPEPGQNDNFYWGACAMQGWRSGMEDTHICQAVEIDGYTCMLRLRVRRLRWNLGLCIKRAMCQKVK